MDGKKLVIQSQKYRGETSVVSMRMPKDMLADIDSVANQTGKARNEVMMLCLEYALSSMEVK